MDGNLGPFRRLLLALSAFFYVLTRRRFAEEVSRLCARSAGKEGALPSGGSTRRGTRDDLRSAEVVSAETAPGDRNAPAGPKAARHAEALQLLALLQREARLIDFASESLDGFSDADIGAAARTVHAGCRKVLETYLALEPVYRDPEGATVTVAEGFDPAAVKLTGEVVGAPPFHGSLRHHGWRAVRTSFPELTGQDPRVLAPAEVEL